MLKSDTLVINLYGGPGSGKSTFMSGIFSELKSRGYNCEMAPEYAKEKVWENSLDILSNQLYVFGKQHQTIFRLLGKVSVIITDSPLFLSLYYGNYCSKSFKNLVLEEHNMLNSINIFINRVKKYNPSGRLQTEVEAKNIDNKLFNLLDQHNIPYCQISGEKKNIIALCDIIEPLIREEKING